MLVRTALADIRIELAWNPLHRWVATKATVQHLDTLQQ